MSHPVHFEIHAADPDRAMAFYGSLFGWTFQGWDGPWPYWMITTGANGSMSGGLMPRRGPPPTTGQPMNAWVMTVEVPSCTAALAKALSLGATTAVELMEVPGVGVMTYCHDTEGNLFGMLEPGGTLAKVN